MYWSRGFCTGTMPAKFLTTEEIPGLPATAVLQAKNICSSRYLELSATYNVMLTGSVSNAPVPCSSHTRSARQCLKYTDD